jgi:hypothetical protein
LTIPSSTELPPDALAMKSMAPRKPIQIDLINISDQKRECGHKHKIQLSKFDKASLPVSRLRSGS